MLINLSNHPHTKWGEKQQGAAIEQYDSIKDISFPNIPPKATEKDIKKLAKQYLQKIEIEAGQNKVVVHIMGEMTFVFRMVKLLKRRKIKCIASTTARNVIENQDGSKTFLFEFVQFREYV